MKTLSVRQPWASYIAYGMKTVEHRAWSTDYRGELLIHASGGPFQFRENADDDDPVALPYGVILARVRLVQVRLFTDGDVEPAMMTEFVPGCAWVLADPQPVQAVRAKGKLRLWEFDGEVATLPAGDCHITAWQQARAGVVVPG